MLIIVIRAALRTRINASLNDQIIRERCCVFLY